MSAKASVKRTATAMAASSSAVSSSRGGPNFFLLTASKDHIDTGVRHGFIQQKHPNRIEKIKSGDFVVAYAGKLSYQKADSYQKVVAIFQADNDNFERMSQSAMLQSLGTSTDLTEASSSKKSKSSKLSVPTEFACSAPVYYRKSSMRVMPGREVPIRDLLDGLDFVQNKQRWGFYFMSGFRHISEHDFEVIRQAYSSVPTKSRQMKK